MTTYDPASVHTLDHPVVAQMITRIRDTRTQPPAFRELVASIGALLAYEATRDLPTETITVTTPITETPGTRLKAPITLVPILRAGLGLSDGVLQLIPSAQVGHLGMARDEATLQPTAYYENIPPTAKTGRVLLVDPMLATGGSAVAAVQRLQFHGCEDLRFLSLIAAPEGIAHLQAHCPGVPIYTAAIDSHLNELGYIVPGLGDAGDRLFGTLH